MPGLKWSSQPADSRGETDTDLGGRLHRGRGPSRAPDGLRATGFHPTNVVASAAYVDALGHSGALRFPVPMIEVLPRPAELFMPIGLKESTKPARYRTADIVLVIDASSSMAGDKLGVAGDAASSLAELALGADNQVAVVAFNADAWTVAWFTADASLARRMIRGIATAPGTRIDLGLAGALELLAEVRPTSTRDQVVIPLTDGRQSGPPDPVLEPAQRARGNGVIVYTIGLGADVDAELLRAIASDTDHAYFAPTADDLADIYGNIARRLPCRSSDYWSRRCP